MTIPSPTRIKDVAQRELTPDWHPPEHIEPQRPRLQSALTGDEPAWVLMLDAGRYDLFDQLVWDYFDGNLTRVYNGGVGYTGDWFARNLDGDYPNAGLFSFLPLRFQEGEYDGSEHFAVAPDIGAEAAVQDRLGALGYAEHTGEWAGRYTAPSAVNETVRQSDLNGGLVRYLKPHPPLEGFEDLTAGSGKVERTKQAVQRGDLSYADLTDAYRATYRAGLQAARELASDLSGPVYLTADHGTCLTCGQLFHGRRHVKHDHLTVVPWFEVDQLL